MIIESILTTTAVWTCDRLVYIALPGYFYSEPSIRGWWYFASLLGSPRTCCLIFYARLNTGCTLLKYGSPFCSQHARRLCNTEAAAWKKYKNNALLCFIKANRKNAVCVPANDGVIKHQHKCYCICTSVDDVQVIMCFSKGTDRPPERDHLFLWAFQFLLCQAVCFFFNEHSFVFWRSLYILKSFFCRTPLQSFPF